MISSELIILLDLASFLSLWVWIFTIERRLKRLEQRHNALLEKVYTE